MPEELADDDARSCANPDCQVGEDGKCVEGLELEACPYFGKSPELSEEESEEEPIDEPRSQRLPSGDTLTVEQVSRLMRKGAARVVAIIGPSDAGKTSLIASLYDLFQVGPLGGAEFARSETLHAFERTCHDARATSRRGVPHVARTPFGEVRFYHLELGGDGIEGRLSLALADRAGEEYRSAANDTSTVDTLVEVHNADTLAVLVDGERLLSVGARHNVRSEIKLMLQAMADGGGLGYGQCLAAVLTKVDLFDDSAEASRASSDFEALIRELESLFGHLFIGIEAFKVAACPKTDRIARGTGVAELLSFWIRAKRQQPTTVSPADNSGRMFAKLRPLEEQ